MVHLNALIDLTEMEILWRWIPLMEEQCLCTTLFILRKRFLCSSYFAFNSAKKEIKSEKHKSAFFQFDSLSGE